MFQQCPYNYLPLDFLNFSFHKDIFHKITDSTEYKRPFNGNPIQSSLIERHQKTWKILELLEVKTESKFG